MSSEDKLLDEKLLSTLRASVNAVRDVVPRSVKLIEQSRIMLREFDIRAGSKTIGERT